MMTSRDLDGLNLDVDLERGVVPISRATSSLAALIRRSASHRQPVIVTQKGYPTAVLLAVSDYVALRQRAETVQPGGPSPDPAASYDARP